MPAQVAPHPPPTQPIQRLWQVLADGLQVQRLHLHLTEWRDLVEGAAPLPDSPDIHHADAFAARPVRSTSTALPDVAGLGFWLELPAKYGLVAAPSNPLTPAALGAGHAVIGDSSQTEWSEAVRCVVNAAAWWVGFFSVIRHRGVHHITLDQAKPDVSLATLSDAVTVVAFGTAIRVLEAHLSEAGESDESARSAYCRALAASVESERRMPGLLDELAELRLVDLVAASIPWRGQYTKYAGGTGAGQVE
ncbi:MAG: hypothetical protein HY241_00540 [Actinobacteria bacterium]|nr:hypothetical protein [Actinomycetota bacterium]